MLEIDWHQRGYCDYPHCDLYPRRDCHSEKDEKEYLTGWWKKANELLTENEIILKYGEG